MKRELIADDLPITDLLKPGFVMLTDAAHMFSDRSTKAECRSLSPKKQEEMMGLKHLKIARKLDECRVYSAFIDLTP